MLHPDVLGFFLHCITFCFIWFKLFLHSSKWLCESGIWTKSSTWLNVSFTKYSPVIDERIGIYCFWLLGFTASDYLDLLLLVTCIYCFWLLGFTASGYFFCIFKLFFLTQNLFFFIKYTRVKRIRIYLFIP